MHEPTLAAILAQAIVEQNPPKTVGEAIKMIGAINQNSFDDKDGYIVIGNKKLSLDEFIISWYFWRTQETASFRASKVITPEATGEIRKEIHKALTNQAYLNELNSDLKFGRFSGQHHAFNKKQMIDFFKALTEILK